MRSVLHRWRQLDVGWNGWGISWDLLSVGWGQFGVNWVSWGRLGHCDGFCLVFPCAHNTFCLRGKEDKCHITPYAGLWKDATVGVQMMHGCANEPNDGGMHEMRRCRMATSNESEWQSPPSLSAKAPPVCLKLNIHPLCGITHCMNRLCPIACTHQ
uniref:Uncharacterized protein n=1 Tax=Eutreptiella gymnastica TaxID=73025 RepID=A0A7S1N154_9EUGL